MKVEKKKQVITKGSASTLSSYILENIFDRQEALLTADLDEEASDVEAYVDMKHSILKHKADGDNIGLGAVAHEKRAVRHRQQQFVCRVTKHSV